jgi:hypothetical protein
MHTKGDADISLFCYAHVNKRQLKYQETFGKGEGTFTNIVNHTTFMFKHLTKIKRKDRKYCQNTLRNWTPYLDAWGVPQAIKTNMTNDNNKRKCY